MRHNAYPHEMKPALLFSTPPSRAISAKARSVVSRRSPTVLGPCRIAALEQQKKDAMANDEFERCASIRDEINAVRVLHPHRLLSADVRTAAAARSLARRVAVHTEAWGGALTAGGCMCRTHSCGGRWRPALAPATLEPPPRAAPSRTRTTSIPSGTWTRREDCGPPRQAAAVHLTRTKRRRRRAWTLTMGGEQNNWAGRERPGCGGEQRA